MSQIIMILLISLLVLVHEIGHFIAARLCGVRVTRFGIGMPIGPSWKMFKWNNTSFYIHAFLFGGYVSFADDEKNFEDSSIKIGEESKEESKEEKKDKNAPAKDEYLPSDSPELYDNKTITQKFFIVSAGVLMNVIFAYFLVMLCALWFHKLPASKQDIFIESSTEEITSNINEKNIQKNDKIIKINSKNIDSFYKLMFFTKNSKLFDDWADNNLININLEELKKLNPEIKPDTNLKGKTIILPKPKAEAPLDVNENVLMGLEKYKKKDVSLSKTQIDLRNKIYNQTSYTPSDDIVLSDVALALSDTYKPLSITLLRDGKEIKIDNVILNEKGILGINVIANDIYYEIHTFGDVVGKSIDYINSTVSMMLFSLWQLITGKVSISDMHGVIAIVKVGGDIIASKGILNGLLLTAMISINLAIMNFLPIPALDGGHVMFLIIEKLTGKKPSMETSEKINNFFFILLILLMVAICYNDIFALITKKF